MCRQPGQIGAIDGVLAVESTAVIGDVDLTLVGDEAWRAAPAGVVLVRRMACMSANDRARHPRGAANVRPEPDAARCMTARSGCALRRRR